MKVAFYTLGCKVNQYETEYLKEQFKKIGYEIVDPSDEADIYVVNTCTVTNLADRKSRQYIRRMKEKKKDSIVIVTGCYSEVSPKDLIDMPEVDIVTGNGEKEKLIEYLNEYKEKKEKVVHVLPYEELTSYPDTGIIVSMDNRTRAYIKIEEGCDRFCSYCLIPFARGHVRSRNPEEVILEAKTLISKGFKEIVLTGINTALYGTEKTFIEKYGNLGIELIIKEINNIDGDFRIRLSSLEPTVINKDYVKSLLKYDKLCPHLHLSIQSGANNVLKLMNRRYTRDEYLDIVKVLREKDSGFGITTDIIVGFPGETKDDFNDTLDIVKKANFLKVHTFKYSKRKRTKALTLPNHIDGNIKIDRSNRLIEYSNQIQNNFLDSEIGKVRIVLFEEEEEYFVGYTENYIKTYVNGDIKLNTFRKVKLVSRYKDGMKGELYE